MHGHAEHVFVCLLKFSDALVRVSQQGFLFRLPGFFRSVGGVDPGLIDRLRRIGSQIALNHLTGWVGFPSNC